MDFFKARLFIFFFIMIILSFLEIFNSYRKRELARWERWPANILLVLIDSFLIRLLFPAGLVGIVTWANDHHFGFLNYFKFDGKALLTAVTSFVVLDLAIYLQHVYSHKWRILWRFHKVHHTDCDLDVTSALRFHPVEIFYSYLFKAIIVLLLGASQGGVMTFEIVLNSMAMFNHANIFLPIKFERKLRFFLVTPQMHIIHHSIEKMESDKNFGFNFSCWDFIFKTYQSTFLSRGVIGQDGYSNYTEQKIIKLLLQPFRKNNNVGHRV